MRVSTGESERTYVRESERESEGESEIEIER